MKKAIALFLCAWFAYPAGFVQAKNPQPVQKADDLIQKPYLDLLELRDIRTFSSNEIKAVEERLKKEKEAEQSRLKKEEERTEKALKAARKRLDDLNKKASRDDAETQKQRTDLHCEVLGLEADLANAKTEREKGVPIIFQNRFAKLELIQRWPQIRSDIENKIENGQARMRPYGNVEDIGIRNLGMDDLAEKQQKDVKTGQDAIRQMKSEGITPPEVEDKALTSYVEKLALTISHSSDLKVPIKVTLLDSLEINAFALPGGFLFVNTGLINKTETESELVGVLSHEIAHAAARHGARLMKRATLADIFFQGAQIAAVVLTGGAVGVGTYYALQYGFYGLGMLLDLTLLGVSRDYEAEADQLGAQYAWHAGYDPQGFITFFDKMTKEEGYVKAVSFFRTHPPFLERIISTFSEITYLPPKQDLRLDSSGFIEAKSRVSALVKQREGEQKTRPTLHEAPPECSTSNRAHESN